MEYILVSFETCILTYNLACPDICPAYFFSKIDIS